MEKRINRVLSLILALVMVVGLIPMSPAHVHAAESSIELEPKLASYRWETTESGTTLKNITTEGYTRNAITGLNGTVNGTALTDVYGQFTDAVILLPTDEWTIEWESAGNWTGMLVSKAAKYGNAGNMFVYHAGVTNSFTIGERIGTTYHNNGFSKSLVEEKFTAAGKTYVNADTHVFRIVNRVSGDTNVPYLFIDGVEIGAMTNCYHGSGTTVNDCGYGMAGRTIELNYFGANGKALNATNFGYLEITGAHTHTGEWTKGETEMTRTCTTCGAAETAPYTAYRWEVKEDVFQSVATDETYTENKLSGSSGTIVDGLFTDVRRTISTGVTLKHNRPWVIQWNAKGNWEGILLSSHSSATAGMDILFKKATIATSRPGLVIGGRDTNYRNYGVKMPAVKSYFDDYAVWRVENQVNADGTNMVFLYINDTLIGDMTYYFVDATATDGTQGDYVNGRDLYYKYFGMSTSHDISKMTLDYLEIWPNGRAAVIEDDEEEHVCDFKPTGEVFKGTNCQEFGYEVYKCECGETKNEPNQIAGDHSFNQLVETVPGADCETLETKVYKCEFCTETETVNGTEFGKCPFEFVSTQPGADCQTPGYDFYECPICGETKDVVNEDAKGNHNYTIEGETTKGADCQTAGTTVMKCACGAETTVTNENAKGDHKYTIEGETNKGADCQTAGTTVMKCACGAETTVTNENAKGDCDFSIKLGLADIGDCKHEVKYTYQCSKCDNTTEIATEGDFGPHNFGDWTYNAGDDSVTRYCPICETTEIALITVEVNGELNGYTDVNHLMKDLPSYENALITLWADVTVDNLELRDNNVLQMQGRTLTVNEFMFVNEGSCIADFYCGDALLKVKQENLGIMGNNDHGLLIWDAEANGYRITNASEIKFQEIIQNPSANSTVYYFLPEVYVNSNILKALAMEGHGGLEVKVTLSWTKNGESYRSDPLVYTDELIERFYNAYDAETDSYAYAFKLALTGTEGVEDLTFRVSLQSAASTYYYYLN